MVAVVNAGPITSFGSITVGDVKFDTSQADIRFEDRAGREDELRLGMYVVVESVRETTGVARARRVVFRRHVEGIIERLDVATNTLVILGQTVRVDGLTVLEDRGQAGALLLSAFAVGDFVAVSGAAASTGVVLATRLERKTGFVAGSTEVEVRGVIGALDTNARTFRLGPLTVNFSTATVNGTLSNGTFVEVRGTQVSSMSVLRAARVSIEDAAFAGLGEAGMEGDLEGVVTGLTSTALFRVNGRLVLTNAQTTFENGTVASLTLNVFIRVQGTLDSNGALVARRVVFRQRNGGSIRITADVEALSTANATVTLLEIVVRLNERTQFKDDMGGERLCNRDRIQLRDRLEIRAFIDAQNTVVATRIRRRDRDRTRDVLLQGPVESASTPTRMSRGVTIRTDAATELSDVTERRLLATQFFASVQRWALVKVRGSVVSSNPSIVQAADVEFEDEERNDDLSGTRGTGATPVAGIELTPALLPTPYSLQAKTPALTPAPASMGRSAGRPFPPSPTQSPLHLGRSHRLRRIPQAPSGAGWGCGAGVWRARAAGCGRWSASRAQHAPSRTAGAGRRGPV